ncbi:hypothetical protein P8452_16219 [Trifolium repens]|nr:hypothetical protein P8452_16219 [Trifolium repens]
MRETEKYTNRRVRRRQLPSTASYGCGSFRLHERERGFTFSGFVECKGNRIYTVASQKLGLVFEEVEILLGAKLISTSTEHGSIPWGWNGLCC